MLSRLLTSCIILLWSCSSRGLGVGAFQSPKSTQWGQSRPTTTRTIRLNQDICPIYRPSRQCKSSLDVFGKMFESKGPLGPGITVGKVQICLASSDSVYQDIKAAVNRNRGSSSSALAKLAHNVGLSVLRRSDDWVSACSESKWFAERDAGRAESLFNEWSNTEASKFEKEYQIGESVMANAGTAASPSLVVVSLLLEIEGDETKLDGAGFSLSGTKDVLNSMVSNVLVDGGEVVNAVECFWTPGDPREVLTSRDLILDFPELIDL